MMLMRSEENNPLQWLDVLDDRPRMAQCCRLGAAKRRASAGPGAKVLARSMAIANRAAWQIGGRRGTAETAAQYAAKYDGYLTTVRAAAPTKPILCITPILNRADLKTGGNQNGERPDFYRDRIASVVRRRQQSDSNLYFLDGLTLIDDPLFLLVTDNVHPNDAGMHRIAQGVAAALKPILASVG
jgi:lysophospholipase L1-like esterase